MILYCTWDTTTGRQDDFVVESFKETPEHTGASPNHNSFCHNTFNKGSTEFKFPSFTLCFIMQSQLLHLVNKENIYHMMQHPK